jgi:hypothetical protein
MKHKCKLNSNMSVPMRPVGYEVARPIKIAFDGEPGAPPPPLLPGVGGRLGKGRPLEDAPETKINTFGWMSAGCLKIEFWQ